MAKALGETFGPEVIDAGLGGLPFAWGETNDTIIGRDDLTPQQNATLDGVVAAHDPSAKVPPDPAADTTLLYEHENRIRALEGVPPMTIVDFVGKVRTK